MGVGGGGSFRRDSGLFSKIDGVSLPVRLPIIVLVFFIFIVCLTFDGSCLSYNIV